MSADGTWNCTLDTPMGAQQMTLTLKTDGNKLSGSLAGGQGTMEFTDGTVDGNNLSWSVQLERPMPMKVDTTATIDGDTLTGESILGSFGKAKITGTRA